MLVTSDNYPEALSYVMQHRGSGLVVDTETDGLEPYRGSRLVGVAIRGHEPGAAPWYFPFRHAEAGMGSGNLGRERLRWLLEELLPVAQQRGTVLLGHNLTFDLQVLAQEYGRISGRYGVLPSRIQDTLLLAHLINENEESFSLKRLGAKYLGADADAEETLLLAKLKGRGYRGKEEMWRLPAAEVEPYACQDVELTWQLRRMYTGNLRSQGLTDVYDSVNDYQLSITRAESRGLLLDRTFIAGQIERIQPELDSLRTEAEALAGEGFNPNSSHQIQRYFGRSSVNKDVLSVLAESSRSSMALLLQKWRVLAKAKSVYWDAFIARATGAGTGVAAEADTGVDTGVDTEPNVLHPQFRVWGTITGRLTSQNPNVQAIPRDVTVYPVKRAFTPRAGCYLLEIDYAQAEIRIGVHYARRLPEYLSPHMPGVSWRAGDLQHLERMLTSGGDIHSETARLLGVPRQVAKRVNLGVMYGIGANSLSTQLGVPVDQARLYLTQYHALYPGWRVLSDQLEHFARSRGWIRLWAGRYRHYTGVPDTEYHKAMSVMVQGGNSELMRVVINRLQLLRAEGVHLLLQVHDSVLLEIETRGRSQAQLEALEDEVVRIMTEVDFTPAMLVDKARSGRSWGDMSSSWDGIAR